MHRCRDCLVGPLSTLLTPTPPPPPPHPPTPAKHKRACMNTCGCTRWPFPPPRESRAGSLECNAADCTACVLMTCSARASACVGLVRESVHGCAGRSLAGALVWTTAVQDAAAARLRCLRSHLVGGATSACGDGVAASPTGVFGPPKLPALEAEYDCTWQASALLIAVIAGDARPRAHTPPCLHSIAAHRLQSPWPFCVQAS